MIKSFSLWARSSRSACFVFVFFLLLFRLMVGREALGAFVGGLGPHVGGLGPYVGCLGAYVAVLGRS